MRDFDVGDLVRTENGDAGTITHFCAEGLPILDIDIVQDAGWPIESLKPAAPASSDPINHPDHYQSESGIECIDAIRAALTPEEFRGYCKGAALKYIWRERKKGGDESLGKGVWYLNEAQK